MQKIISLFKRNYETDYLVRNEIVDGAEWVISGEGVATRKYNGTCCMIRNGNFLKRYELKPGKTRPWDFTPASTPDVVTGNIQGWVPVGVGNEDKYHREAFVGNEPDGTYELVGPKIQGGAEKQYEKHVLIRHADAEIIDDFPRDFDGIKNAFKDFPYEGIVFHHPDGRMVKIKVRDFYKKGCDR